MNGLGACAVGRDMMLRILLVLLLSIPITARAEAPAADIQAVVAKIQAFYEKTDGIDTRFTQTFRHGGMPSRLGGATAEGRLRFRKPVGESGPRMRWDYDDGRILLLVGDLSYTYDPDTQQITLYRLDPKTLSAAVSFLWGKGKLTDDFKVTASGRKDLGEGVALELVPKTGNGGFSKVLLLVDGATGLVRRSVVVQADGSENHITFVEPKVGEVAPLSVFNPDTAFPKDAVRVDTQIGR